ncbi:MAG: ROK family transcriptional regulator [Lachnospiraceae bacterium]|jgi:N-acetylglucosamine repressor|nr:ROK family transcriptional regulator [Lachnospiraceae bacterium]
MGLNNAEIKRVNRNNILRYLLKSEIVSKNRIAYDLELTAPTVTSALKDLQKLGLVKEEGAMDSIGGRKSMGYSCDKDAKYAVGVSIKKNYVNLAVINLAADAVCKRHEDVQIQGDESSYQWLQEFIASAIDETGISDEKILGVGYALPATVDQSGRKIYGLHEEMDLPWNFYEIAQEWFSYPTVLQRDAVSAGAAVAKALCIENTAIYLDLSSSVGGAVLRKGEPVKLGINCRKGEFGHLTIVPDGKPCFCGRRGCVDAYCSTDNLSVLADGSLKLFFERMENGDARCGSVWEEYLDYLALTIHNLMNCFDEKLILGGELAEYLEPYMKTIKDRVVTYDHYLKEADYLSPGSLGFDAASIGAAGYFIDKYITKI